MAAINVLKELEDPKSRTHEVLLAKVKGFIESSRKEMAKHYDTWDEHDAAFRALRPLDKEDRNSKAKGKPTKMIVQLNFSQIMTYVAFGVMMVTQNKRFFELEPTGTEDNPLREPMELVLDRDCRKNEWASFLVQFFLDTGRFSLGAAEICWLEEKRKIRTQQSKVSEGAFGVESEEVQEEWTEIPTFVGNKVYPVSPFRFFPDVSLPLTRYQEGEFCGSEDMFSLSSLKARGDCFNLDKIPKMDQKTYDARKQISRIGDMEVRQNPNMGGDGGEGHEFVKSGTVVVTKCVCDIVPKDVEVDGKPLGEENFPVRKVCWYANDATIIKWEDGYYLHGMFPYVCAQFLPDQHKTINEGLADVCKPITELITWLINAHVTSIQSTVEGKFLVDPAGVDIKSLESRSPYIFLKKNASQTGVERYITQFNVQDVTGNFMQDASGLKDLQETVTGFSAQMQGQYSQGRRSATQDRVVAQGAGARGKMTLSTIWDSAFEKMGKQMIANNRQEMDYETFARIVGQGPHGTAGDMSTEDLFALFKADPVTIATAEDFFVFDGTSPSEKAFLAQSLQEILMQIFSNPQVAAVLGYGPEQVKALMRDVYNLRGVTPASLPAPAAPASPVQVPPQLSVVPPPAQGTPA